MENTQRFSDRVDAYVKYRPGYPSGIIPFFIDSLGLHTHHQIADIGSGTGKLTELFAEEGYEIMGVEPNEEMRLAGEKLLSHYPNFTSVDGTAESTTLSQESVDFIL
ncbi:MAG: class I SAM-dependent methyltransferase, partial [Bacteroidota bacterium]